MVDTIILRDCVGPYRGETRRWDREVGLMALRAGWATTATDKQKAGLEAKENGRRKMRRRAFLRRMAGVDRPLPYLAATDG